MTPDLIVVGVLFLLRIAVTLALVLVDGFLAARYLETRSDTIRKARSRRLTGKPPGVTPQAAQGGLATPEPPMPRRRATAAEED